MAQYEEKPKAGDCIEIFRGQYQHWALYVGDGCVVHLAPSCEIPGGSANSLVSVWTEKATVQKDALWNVIGNHKWMVNNKLDEKYEPRKIRIIVRDALDLVGLELPYSVVSHNCEHFVNELRYGQAESRQVCQVRDVALAAGAATLLTVGVAALAAVFFSGNKKEEKTKR